MPDEVWSFNVSVGELRRIANLVLDHLQQVVGESVELPVDYYWNIPSERMYNVLEDPGDFDIGQLTEDWDDLRRLLDQEENDPLCLDLVDLGALLRAIGQHVGE